MKPEDFEYLNKTSAGSGLSPTGVEVVNEGTCILLTHTLTSRMLEELVVTILQPLCPEGTRVDWCWSCGRASIMALGDVAAANNALKTLRPIHDAMFRCASGDYKRHADQYTRILDGIWGFQVSP